MSQWNFSAIASAGSRYKSAFNFACSFAEAGNFPTFCRSAGVTAGDEDRFDGGKIEAVDIRGGIAFSTGWRQRRLFAARLPIKRKRFPGEFIIAPINFARTKV